MSQHQLFNMNASGNNVDQSMCHSFETNEADAAWTEMTVSI